MPIFGLIGNPLSHSFSAGYFRDKFMAMGLNDFDYKNFELSNIDQLIPLLKKNPEIASLNVTVPYKKAVVELMDDLSGEAMASGAVNCISVVRKAGEIFLKGYNTDIEGFRRSNFKTKKDHGALVLGSGGAAGAITYVLREKDIPFHIVSREPANEHEIGYNDITSELLSINSLIINCTPVGMYPNTNQMPPFPVELLSNEHFVYDLIYNPAETKLLKEAFARGAETKNGLDMLHIQAEESWNIWLNDHELENKFPAKDI